MSASALDRVIQLSQTGQPPQGTPPADEIRYLARDVRALLSEALTSGDPREAVELIACAVVAADNLGSLLYTDGLPETQVPLADQVRMSVLTAEQRRSPSAHTIGGSDDYPIPDKPHLSAALARYKEGKLAGHSKDEVRKHILSRAQALGVEVDLAGVLGQIMDGGATVYLAGATPPGDIPMHHAPFTGKHSHAHRVTLAHHHEHEHNGDAEHVGSGHGSNSKEKSYPFPREQQRY